MRLRRKKPGKPKRVHYELIPRDDVASRPMYALLGELVDKHHRDLCDARIELAWCTSWRPDVDGRVTLGQCRKASDLDRELVAIDFVILLSRPFWRSQQFTIDDASQSDAIARVRPGAQLVIEPAAKVAV
jgi:hypothetical protein